MLYIYSPDSLVAASLAAMREASACRCEYLQWVSAIDRHATTVKMLNFSTNTITSTFCRAYTGTPKHDTTSGFGLSSEVKGTTTLFTAFCEKLAPREAVIRMYLAGRPFESKELHRGKGMQQLLIS